jgi:hypothetical protein
MVAVIGKAKPEDQTTKDTKEHKGRRLEQSQIGTDLHPEVGRF